MRSIGAGLLLLLLVVASASAAYAADRRGSIAPTQLACEPHPERPHLALRPSGTTFPRRQHVELELFVENPTEHGFRYHGAQWSVEHYLVRWDGRLAPRERMQAEVDFIEGYNGTDVPPQTSWRFSGMQAYTDQAGEHVLVARMEELCGLARYRVA